MAVLKGCNLIIKMAGVAIAGAKSCELTIQADDIETSSPSTGAWCSFIPGRKEWSASCGHLIPAIGTPLKSDAAMVGSTVSLTFETEQEGDTLSGSAIVKQWKVSGNVGHLVSGSFSFKGTGELK